MAKKNNSEGQSATEARREQLHLARDQKVGDQRREEVAKAEDGEQLRHAVQRAQAKGTMR